MIDGGAEVWCIDGEHLTRGLHELVVGRQAAIEEHGRGANKSLAPDDSDLDTVARLFGDDRGVADLREEQMRDRLTGRDQRLDAIRWGSSADAAGAAQNHRVRGASASDCERCFAVAETWLCSQWGRARFVSQTPAPRGSSRQPQISGLNSGAPSLIQIRILTYVDPSAVSARSQFWKMADSWLIYFPLADASPPS